ncbi:MAG: thiolase family protein [Pseudonocardiaceae bacterium]|nr:MAG: thiolase family protein [Pseudonocardiaceae bacterium]
MTPFGIEGDLAGLARSALVGAVTDSGLGIGQVEEVYFGNGAAGLLQGQEMVRGQVILKDVGLGGVPLFNVENACASSSSAFVLAVTAVLAGRCDVAVALGAEQLVVEDKTRSFGALAAAADTIRIEENRAFTRRWALGILDGEPEEEVVGSPLMAHYAEAARSYMAISDATPADLALVVQKSRAAAVHNPIAQFRRPVEVAAVLEAREVSSPLTVPMCSPLSNGAAAVVVVSSKVARQIGARVGVRATGEATPGSGGGMGPAERSAALAYERAGVSPSDISVVELHDAAASAELMLMESVMLCGKGEAVDLLRRGETALGGRVPVNVSGGLLSRGHPIGATGCAQIAELADQLRGRCGGRQVERPRLGLAQNSGGVLGDGEAVSVVSVLEAV